MMDDEPTRLLRELLAAVTGLDVLPRAGPAGCVILAPCHGRAAVFVVKFVG